MASEIKVDTIVNAGGDNDTGIDLATNDQILLKVANATRLTMNSTGQTTIVGEGGTTTTSLQQGLAKAWGNHSGVNRNANDSLNIASTSDAGTGAGTYTFTNNMNGADYSVPLGALYNSSDGDGMHPYGQINSGTFSTSTFRVDVLNYDDTNDGDCNMVWTSVHGDLA